MAGENNTCHITPINSAGREGMISGYFIGKCGLRKIREVFGHRFHKSLA